MTYLCRSNQPTDRPTDRKNWKTRTAPRTTHPTPQNPPQTLTDRHHGPNGPKPQPPRTGPPPYRGDQVQGHTVIQSGLPGVCRYVKLVDSGKVERI